MAIVAVASVSAIGGMRSLARDAGLESARRILVDALLEARRIAYVSADGASLVVEPGSSSVSIVTAAGTSRSVKLPAGAVVTSAPADGDVSFRASGLADNATIRLAIGATASEVAVVVNQRGVVR